MGWLILVGFSILSGVLGRMGGAEGYNTKFRDVGCSLVAIVALWVVFGPKWGFWWVYLLCFGLTWGSFCTYWDKLFGYDNLWFSGFMVGLAFLPTLFIDIHLWIFVLARAIILAVSWGCLNKFLPKKVLFWRRDVAEEFLRYAISF